MITDLSDLAAVLRRQGPSISASKARNYAGVAPAQRVICYSMRIRGVTAAVPDHLVADGVVCDLQWAINPHAIAFEAGAYAPDADDDAVIEAGDRHGPVEVAALCAGWPPSSPVVDCDSRGCAPVAGRPLD